MLAILLVPIVCSSPQKVLASTPTDNFSSWLSFAQGTQILTTGQNFPVSGSMSRTENTLTVQANGGEVHMGAYSQQQYDFTLGGDVSFHSNLNSIDYLAFTLTSDFESYLPSNDFRLTPFMLYIDGWGNSYTFNPYAGRCRADQWPPGKILMWMRSDVCEPSFLLNRSGLGEHDFVIHFDAVMANHPQITLQVDGQTLGSAPLPESWITNPVRSPVFWVYKATATISNLQISTQQSVPLAPTVNTPSLSLIHI